MALNINIIREQFPALAIKDEGKARVYLDNPGGTQVPRQVLERMERYLICLLYTSPSPRDVEESRMPSSA